MIQATLPGKTLEKKGNEGALVLKDFKYITKPQ